MKKTIGERFKERYPNSASSASLLLLGPTLVAASAAPRLLFSEKSQTKQILTWGLFWAGIVLLGIFALLFVLETISPITPSLKPIASGFIRFLQGIVRAIRSVYVAFVIFFVKGAVEEIISERERGQRNNFTFRKQATDDHYYPIALNLNRASYKIVVNNPEPPTEYWRIGLKFSKNDAFTSARYAPDYPLIHLAKEKNGCELRLAFYDESGALVYDKTLVPVHTDQRVSMLVTLGRDTAQVTIIGESGEELASQAVTGYRFCQLFSWADGNDYVLNTEISSREPIRS